MSKKIVHITTVHRMRDTRIFYRYCKSLSDEGYSVNLICPSDDPSFAPGSSHVVDEINVNFLRARSDKYSRIVLNIPLIIKKLSETKPDVIHFHDPELLLLIPIFLIFTRKLVYDVHEDNFENILQKKSIPLVLRIILSRLIRTLELFSSKFSSQVIAERYYHDFLPSSIEALNYPSAYQSCIGGQCHYDLSMLNSTYNWFLYTGNVSIERGALLQLEVLLDNSKNAIFYAGYCQSSVYSAIEDWLERHKISKDRFVLEGYEKFVDQKCINYIQKGYPWVAGIAIFPYSDFYNKKELTKFFEYYNACLPILCADFVEWKKFVNKYECGAVYESGYMQRLKNKKFNFTCNRFNWSDELKKVITIYEL